MQSTGLSETVRETEKKKIKSSEWEHKCEALNATDTICIRVETLRSRREMAFFGKEVYLPFLTRAAQTNRS